MAEPLVSVFLPCYNQEGYVDEAIRSAVEDNPKLTFIAAVQPGRAARPAA